MYAGLTISDKPALLDAKARGANWVARDRSGRLYVYVNKPHKGMFLTDEWVMGRTNFVYGTDDASLQFIKWSDAEPVNVDLALAHRASRGRDRKLNLRIALQQHPADRGLPRARGRGNDEHQSAALEGVAGHAR